jgi:uncharacterized membrane protein YfcA
MSLLAAILAILVGITLGLLGGGGSILTVPVVIFALGVDPKTAIVMSLPIVGGAAAVGVVGHWRSRNVDFRVAIPFGIAAMVGAFGGAKLAHFLSGSVQLVLLAAVMLGAAVSMFRNAKLPEPAVDEQRHLGPLVFVVGAFTGVLTGLVGIGGGFLLVPALVVLAGVPMRMAVGTSLFVIVLNTIAGYAGYHGSVEVPWRSVAWFAGATAVGIVIGTLLISRVPQSTLKRAFALLLVAVAALLVWQTVSTF